MRILPFAIATLAVACVADTHPIDYTPKRTPPGECGRTFVVAPEFTADERHALESSVERWNNVAIERFCLRDAKQGEAEQTTHGVFRIAYKSPYWEQLSKNFGGANLIGVHFGGSDQIGIVDALAPDVFEVVAVHEFGHARGLRHVSPPAIMAAIAGSAFDFTDNDMSECRRVGACESDGDSEHPTAMDVLAPIDEM